MGELRRPLTLEDREEISRCLAMCLANKEIAAHIERDESMICREIARNGGREIYRAHRAQSRAEEERCRPKARKMDADPVLRCRVVSGLRSGFSPDQVAGRLKYDRSCGQAGQVAVTLNRCAGELARVRRLGPSRFEAAVRRELPRWGATRPCLRIVRRRFRRTG